MVAPCALLGGILALSLCACKKDAEPSTEGTRTPSAEPEPKEPARKPTQPPSTAAAPADAAPEAKLQLRKLNEKEVGPAMTYKGTLARVYGWSDANGKNVLIFSSMDKEGYDKEMEQPAKSRYLFVNHYASTANAVKRLRLIRDKEENCSWDLTLDFDWPALGLTDLDADGIGEISFAYEKTCRSDVAPSELKVLMLENGDKYIIRGTTMPDGPEYKSVGDMRYPAPSLRTGPASFRKHMNATWEKVVADGVGE